ncbi:Hypothetical predicted protein [Pelobates cultripes]|uniref:Uncharacterized protein n=1 Tax=Pelobates cultripes TaxID=61616 RepID=A0AAD1RCQ6_PELCU|nr:Hypothetical predicted protein [Pelobates cultripes]
MGKCLQRLNTRNTEDIGDLLLRGSPSGSPKMAALAAKSFLEGKFPLDALDELPTTGGEADTLATKSDINSLSKEIRSLFHAYPAINREDIHYLTDRIRVTEEEAIEIKTKQVTLKEFIARMTWTQEGIEAKLAEQDDKSQHNKVKICGVPEEVDATGLP